LDSQLRKPLKRVMWGGDAELLQNTEFAQPALFALEVALAALWQSWGVVPDAVMGHSVGEIAAAYVAGVLSLQDAAKVVAARGRLMAGLPAGGAMVALAASEAEVAPLLAEGVSIAVVNGPKSVVISGEQVAVGAVAERLAQRGRRVHRLAVSHAFHSVLMEPMIAEFGRVLAGVSAVEPRIGLVSNVTGRLAGPGYGSADYWVGQMRAPVRFVDGVQVAESLGAGVFVEVGPGGVLTASVEQSLTTEQAISVVTMAKDRSEVDSLLTAAGRLFATGMGVQWAAVFAGLGAQRVELPTYAFQRRRFWLGTEGDAPSPIKTRSGDFAERLKSLTPNEQHRQLVELVCTHAAAVLGHSGSHDIDAERVFQDLGFESLTGVELRNRLKTDTGLALSRTLIFDYPTPTALADHLQQLLHGDHEESEDEKILSTLRKIPLHELRRTGLLDKLLLLAGEPEKVVSDPAVSADIIDSLSPDALIAMALDPDEDNGGQ
jgi:acyl transferase domain-containing protein